MLIKKHELIWIVPRLPWPARCGASLANSELIRGMSELGYKVHVICFTADDVTRNRADKIRTALGAAELSFYRWPLLLRTRWTRTLTSIILGFFRRDIPMTAVPYTTSAVRRFLQKMTAEKRNAVCVWDGLHPMASISLTGQSPHASGLHIYRAHNVESMIWQDFVRSSAKLLWPVLKIQAAKMKRFELRCIEISKHVACVHENDMSAIQASTKKSSVSVIPISVPESRDLLKITVQRWSRVNIANIKDDALQLLWLGGLDWWPNREALEWFAQHIWKQLQKNRPRVSLTLVGRGTDRLRDLSGENVRRLGFVKDLSAVFDETDLLIAPIQSGSGVRVKVIEALSQAVPCVGTTLGVEGIPPQGIYCVDSPRRWLRVLSSVTVQECFLRGMVGARAIQAEHSRVRCAGQFDALLQSHLKS
ncbi:MAG: hypothetical protein RLZZ488_2086 [Pseudomonadota bacterium]|jgi:glycosyltransferase involved in cell wall biosynthesis